MNKSHLEEVAAYIREYRSNESNFEKLQQKLQEEIDGNDNDYGNQLKEIQEKNIEEYNKAKETSGAAWPEFEKFVSAFEKAVLAAMQNTV